MKPKILCSTSRKDPVNYTAAVQAAGGCPVAGYLPTPDLSYDGLLLAGGSDMDPSYFGQEDRGSLGIDRDRDRTELALLDAFLGAGKPVLAICRGCQVVNVWLGGNLIQDLGERNPLHLRMDRDQVHQICAKSDSILCRMYGERFSVNSHHHQGIDCLGRGLRATAYSDDGVVEAIEHESFPLVAVQFHPERMTGVLVRPDTVDGGAIFTSFLAMCQI